MERICTTSANADLGRDKVIGLIMGKSGSFFVGGILVGALLAAGGFALYMCGQKAAGSDLKQTDQEEQ